MFNLGGEGEGGSLSTNLQPAKLKVSNHCIFENRPHTDKMRKSSIDSTKFMLKTKYFRLCPSHTDKLFAHVCSVEENLQNH